MASMSSHIFMKCFRIHIIVIQHNRKHIDKLFLTTISHIPSITDATVSPRKTILISYFAMQHLRKLETNRP